MHDDKLTGKRKPFAVINNVRDHCDLPDSSKLLLMILATYCDDEAVCFPGNRKLADAMRWKSAKTVTRTLKKLAAAGELEILTTGRGRGGKRQLRLTRYVESSPQKWDTGVSHLRAAKWDTGVSGLNGTRSEGKAPANPQENCQKGKGKGKGSPKFSYPGSEAEMRHALESLGIEYDAEHAGTFLRQMQLSGWTISERPVIDWPATYAARLRVIRSRTANRRSKRRLVSAVDYSRLTKENAI